MRTSTTIKQPIAIPIASQNENDPVIQTRQNLLLSIDIKLITLIYKITCIRKTITLPM